MLWGFLKFFALGGAALAVLVALLHLWGGWGLLVAAGLALAWALPR